MSDKFTIYDSDKEFVWAKFEDGKIAQYKVVGETHKKYYCVGYNSCFFMKKEQGFDTKDDLMFDRFAKVCIAKLRPNSKAWALEKNLSKKHGIKELNRYLKETKQQAYATRFMNEYAEHLI